MLAPQASDGKADRFPAHGFAKPSPIFLLRKIGSHGIFKHLL
jgi:hypothetical protein